MRFNKNGDLIPQKVKYVIKHNEMDREAINEYTKKECNFKIQYNNKGKLKFIKRDE